MTSIDEFVYYLIAKRTGYWIGFYVLQMGNGVT